MDVYLVPIGAEQYELYCEVPDDVPVEPRHEEQTEPPPGRFRRLVHRVHYRRLVHGFREMLAEAERERRQGRPAGTPRGWMSRAKARSMRWVAESIAEQRLLWHMRSQTAACLFYPDDMEGPRATALLRAQLGRDFDKHRFWLVIDSLGLVASGLLMLVPGPNLLAYYFAFRIVGHYLSLRGAKQGLGGVAWRNEASAPLTELRKAINLDPEVRERRVDDVASRLRLEHLASFFKRTAIST